MVLNGIKDCGDIQIKIVNNETYPLLNHAVAALVTNGTATLGNNNVGVPSSCML